MATRRAWSGAMLLVGLLALPAWAQQGGPTQADLNAASTNAADWLHTNHDYGGQRFVGATDINRENAHSLRPVCRHELKDPYPFQTNPIVYRGVM